MWGMMAMSTKANPVPGDTLDCGHRLTHPLPDRAGTGYGRDWRGRTACYPCCHQTELFHMERDKRISAYLSMDGRHITGWPGFVLAFVRRETTGSAGGFARDTTVTRVWAQDAAGNWWHGRGPGRGMYINLRWSKDKRNRGGI